MRFKIVMVLVVLALVVGAIGVTIAANRADAAEGKWRADDPGAAILRLGARVKEL